MDVLQFFEGSVRFMNVFTIHFFLQFMKESIQLIKRFTFLPKLMKVVHTI